MKLIYYILICCLLGLISCGESNSLANFSKRKYLKKAPKQKAIKQETQSELKIYATNSKASYDVYTLEEIPEVDYEPELLTTQLKPIILKNTYKKKPYLNRITLFNKKSKSIFDEVVSGVSDKQSKTTSWESLIFSLLALGSGVVLLLAITEVIAINSATILIPLILMIMFSIGAITSASKISKSKKTKDGLSKKDKVISGTAKTVGIIVLIGVLIFIIAAIIIVSSMKGFSM